jgi:hypothetical protein
MWRWLLSFVVIGCASSRAPYRPQLDEYFAAHPTRARASPNVLGTGPWPVGRWATYSRIGEYGTRGIDTISVVAIDACGTWIQQESVDDDRLVRRLVCVRESDSPDPLAIVREVRFQGAPDLPSIAVEISDRTALRELVGPLVAKLVDHTRANGLGGGDHELVESGDGHDTSVISSLARRTTNIYFGQQRRGPKQFSLGIAMGYLGSSTRFEGDTAAAFSGGMAVVITPRLDLVATIGLSTTEAPGVMDHSIVVAGVGVRGRPWSGRFFVEGDLGFAEVVQDANTVARGGTSSAVIGFDAVVKRGWRASVDARARALLLGNDEGLRLSLVAGWTVHLDL